MRMRVHDERGEWAGSAGVRKPGEAAKPSTDGQFWVGGTTKTFVATLVLQLVADGTIALDAPVAEHLPQLGLDRRITVRMLLQHTSGVYNCTGELAAGLTTGDSAMDPAQEFPKALDRLITAVFRGGRAAS